MKRILCLCLIMLGARLFAADLIITVDGGKIEAYIQEIRSTSVSYKKVTAPDGPLFTINTSDIASIIFSNGDVMAFNNDDNPQPQTYTPQQTSSANIQSVQRPTSQTMGSGTYVQQIGYSKFACGNMQMNRKQYADFLRNNSAYAYSLYRDGVILEYCGWSALGTGVVLIGVLTPFFWPGAIIGGIIAMESAPLLYFGITRQRNSVAVYNMEQSAAKTQLSFRLKPKDFNSDGLGFALSF